MHRMAVVIAVMSALPCLDLGLDKVLAGVAGPGSPSPGPGTAMLARTLVALGQCPAVCVLKGRGVKAQGQALNLVMPVSVGAANCVYAAQ